ncbi:MAG TPA: type II secretion system protein GspM [Polyangia bacterium]|nr:type II secretion system protein GspM [Polyangia bacterium]
MSAITDTITKVREAGRRALARPVGYFTAEWERLAPRERRAMAALAIAIFAVIFLGGTYYLLSSVDDLQEDNAATREALTAIAKHRDEYLEAKARSAAQEARIGNEPPQLISDIEAAAREEQVQIAESSERPTTPAGRRYAEHDVDIKIREVDLQSLSKFLKRLETGPRLIFFTHLSIKKRYSETDKLDVEATATAFERLKEDKTKKKPADKKDSE